MVRVETWGGLKGGLPRTSEESGGQRRSKPLDGGWFHPAREANVRPSSKVIDLARGREAGRQVDVQVCRNTKLALHRMVRG